MTGYILKCVAVKLLHRDIPSYPTFPTGSCSNPSKTSIVLKKKDIFQVVDGYFVHFIAPVGLPAVKKNVLFILDISGSMSGKKLAQTKDAMRVILRDLQPGDLFNIFLFDDRIRRWNATHLVAVDDNSLRVAQEYIKNMSARGCKYYTGWAVNIKLAPSTTLNFATIACPEQCYQFFGQGKKE